LSKVSDRCSRTVDRCTSTRTAPHALPARGLHSPPPPGSCGAAEQKGDLRSLVSCQRGNSSRSRSRSQTPRCRDWFLQRVTHVESATQNSSACPLCRSCRRPLTGSHPLGALAGQLLPAQAVLRKVFRGKFVAALRQAFQNGELRFPEKWKLLSEPKIFAAWLRPLFRQDWVVYLKRPFGGPEYVLHYLGRYTHRVAISNHRLVSFAGGQVTFRWRDSAHHNEQKHTALSHDKFLRRFLLHILPQGFVRIRHFGFLACRRRRTTLPLCFQLLGAPQEALTEEHTSSTEDVPDLYRCPKCGGAMKVIERLTAAETQLRSPPRISSAA